MKVIRSLAMRNQYQLWLFLLRRFYLTRTFSHLMLKMVLIFMGLQCYADNFYIQCPYFRFVWSLIYRAELFWQPKNASFLGIVNLHFVFGWNRSEFLSIDHSFFYGCKFTICSIFLVKAHSFWVLGLIYRHLQALITLMANLEALSQGLNLELGLTAPALL